MDKTIESLTPREGYDRWAESYDRTRSSLVALDRRHTLDLLAPRSGERVLDLGCGTGIHLQALRQAGARPVGLDVSCGMLWVARRRSPGAQLVQADLERPLPIAPGAVDAVLCALVAEHLSDLRGFFDAAFGALAPGGRLVLSVFHPEMVAAGIEAHFDLDGTEYRLGAEGHTRGDYLRGLEEAGFRELRWREYCGDAELIDEVPSAERYLDRLLLLTIEAVRPSNRRGWA